MEIDDKELAELRKDAEKWRKVKDAADSSPPCDCPEWNKELAECMLAVPHCPFGDVVKALEADDEQE